MQFGVLRIVKLSPLFLIPFLFISCKKVGGPSIAMCGNTEDYCLEEPALFENGVSRACLYTDGELVISGYRTDGGIGGQNMFLLGYDLNRGIQWEEAYDSEGDERIFGIHEDADYWYLAGINQYRIDDLSAIVYKIKKSDLSADQNTTRGMGDAQFNGVAVTEDGYMAVGRTDDFIDQQLLVSKRTHSGEGSFQHYLGGSESESAVDVIALNGAYYIYGFTYSFGEGDREHWLVKYENDTVAWTKTYGSPEYEEPQELIATSDGNLLLVGHSAQFDPLQDAHVIKVDLDGNVIWEKWFGGDVHDGCEAVLENEDGNYMVVVRSERYTQSSSIYLMELSPDGELLREKVIDNEGYNEAYSIAEGPYHYHLTGQSEKGLIVVHLNKDFN